LYQKLLYQPKAGRGTLLFSPYVREKKMGIIDIWQLLKKGFYWILDKLGKKIVDKDEFKEETVEVRYEYPEKSDNCIREKENGSLFYWSPALPADIKYERYFEINGNIKRYFTWQRKRLWIKRNKK
jgi:hypothetical protein